MTYSSKTAMTHTIEQLAYRWALHSPEFCLAKTGLLAIVANPARLRDFTRDRAQLDAFLAEALKCYVAHENRFYADSAVATEVSTIGEAAHLHIIELASTEHANAGQVLMEANRPKGTADFYGAFDATLRRSLLPRSQFAVAYCNQRRQDLACVRSFDAWNDRAFYEASVITLVRLRARLKIDLPKIQVAINPVPIQVAINTVPVTINSPRNVTKTIVIERLSDGKIVSTVTEQ